LRTEKVSRLPETEYDFIMPKIPFWIFIIIGLLYLTALRVDTMDVDASQYAEISREMMRSGDYLHIYDRGAEYLDKPPMLFWLSALSMRIFGVGNIGYKLPSVFFAIWSLFPTYRLGKRLYDDATGRMAALILASCQGMFLMTNDIRCDTILMAWVITAMWLIQEWAHSRKILFLMGGAAAIACGMMTKGPIALMVPVFGFGTHWLLQRNWKNIFNPAHLLAIVVIALLLIPMSIGLYQQFDMHPEKLVNGTTGVSGLRFFYWSQSFGRITGESPWNNGAGIDFLLLNMLWSFLPWIFLFMTGLITNCIVLVRQRFRLQQGQEWITTGGFILAYLALGSSAYQLPHYIFVAFPLAAIITARYIAVSMENIRLNKVLLYSHGTISFLLLSVILLIISYVFPAGNMVILLWMVLTVVWVFLVFSKNLTGKLLWLPAAAIIIVNIFFTNFFYAPLLQYQVGSQVGRYMQQQHIAASDVVSYKADDPLNAMHFYAQGVISGIDTLAALQKPYLLTSGRGMEDLLKTNLKYEVVRTGSFYKVSELTPEFLNPKTRATAMKQYYLLRFH